MTDRLSVWPTLYPYAELNAIVGPLFDALGALDQGWGRTGGTGCVAAESDDAIDSYRVEATLFTGDVEPSPELLAQARAIAEPYGDKVRVRIKKGDGRAYPAAGTLPAPVQPAPPAPTPAPAKRHRTQGRELRLAAEGEPLRARRRDRDQGAQGRRPVPRAGQHPRRAPSRCARADRRACA